MWTLAIDDELFYFSSYNEVKSAYEREIDFLVGLGYTAFIFTDSKTARLIKGSKYVTIKYEYIL